MTTQLSSALFAAADFEVESHFGQAARHHWPPIHQLESFEEQMSLLTVETPLAEQVAELRRAIKVHDDPATPDMFARYAAQDLRLLPAEEFSAEPMIARNRRMAERLALLLRDRSVFAIVGAAHLPDVNGMLAALSERGFAITPHPLKIRTCPTS